MDHLRPYQVDAYHKIMGGLTNGTRSALVSMATGLGKTEVFLQVARDWPSRVMIMAHRDELIRQPKERYAARYGEHPEIEKAEWRASEKLESYRCHVTIGSVQTLARPKRRERFDPNDFGLLIIDEAHHAPAKSYRDIISYFQQNHDLKTLGLTATPDRSDEKAMAIVFDEVVYEMGIHEGIRDGWLVPIDQQYVRIEDLDFSECRKTAGDLKRRDLEAVIKHEKVLHGVADATRQVCGEDKTAIIFCVSVDHAQRVQEILERTPGTKAFCLHGKTPPLVRKSVVDALAKKEIQFLTACMVPTEGFDLPNLEVCSMARPTLSRSLFCLADDTEILTPDGWMGIDDEFESAYQYDPDDQSIGSCLINGRVDRPLKDDESMWGINGRHLSISVTDGHRMILAESRGRKKVRSWSVRNASEMSKFESYIPVSGFENVVGANLTDDEIRFIGLVMTDGTIHKTTKAISITQSTRHPECIDYIESVLVSCRFKHNKIKTASEGDATNLGVRRHDQYVWTISYGEPRGRDKHLSGWGHLWMYMDKKMSPWLERLNRDQLLVLVEAMNVGDGLKHKSPSITWKTKAYTICTGQKEVADRIQSLCTRRGIRCSLGDNGQGVAIMIIDPTRQFMHLPTSCSDRTNWGKLEERPERVWCINVPTSYIICRRNGKVFITGNSQMLGRTTRPLPGIVDGLGSSEERREAIANSRKPNCLILDFVGNSGRHSLISTMDILGGRYDDEVVEQAKEMAKKKSRRMSIEEMLDASERRLLEEAMERDRAEARQRVVGRAKFELVSVDPFSVLGFRPGREPGWHKGRLPTPKMKNALAKFGLEKEKIAEMTFHEASQMMSKLIENKNRGLATFKQQRLLSKYGYNDEMSFDEASDLITMIKERGWK